MIPDSRRVRTVLTAVLLAPHWVLGAEVSLIGVFAGKAAVLSIDGGEPRTVRIGQQAAGVKVLSVERDRADVEIDGKRRSLALGQHYRSAGAGPASGRQSVTLAADGHGHFVTEGAINGTGIRFLVDTGATFISIPALEAKRLGIDYRKGRRGVIQTANGPAPAFAVKFDTVRLGGLELNNVDGLVLETGLPIALLGMSFLNRVEMKRDGDTMTLVKRF